MFRPAITSSLLGFVLGLIVWTTPLQAEESQVLTLDGIETLKLSGGLTFEVTCGDENSATITSADARIQDGAQRGSLEHHP